MGGGKNSVKCVWDCYFYSVSELQRHHPGGSRCQDLNSSTWSFLIWWKPYTDTQLLPLFDSFWLVTRRALISYWNVLNWQVEFILVVSLCISFSLRTKGNSSVSEDPPAGTTCGWCPICLCCCWKHAGQCWQTQLALCSLREKLAWVSGWNPFALLWQECITTWVAASYTPHLWNVGAAWAEAPLSLYHDQTICAGEVMVILPEKNKKAFSEATCNS